MHAPWDTARPPRASFASFIYGAESLIAYRAASMAARHPGAASPLTIHGAAGLGKTHLLRAIAGHLAEDGSGRAVCYVQAEVLAREVTAGVQRRRGDAVRGRYARADALLIDDLTALAGSTALLEDVAAIIDAVQGRGGQVVASGVGDPALIKGLPARLRACLCAGLVVRLGRLGLRTRLALARTLVGNTPVRFTEEALHALAHRASGAGELEAAIRRCATDAPRGSVVDAGLAVSVVCALARRAQDAPARCGVDDVVRAAGDAFGVERDGLLSVGRTATVVHARQVTMYLLHVDAGLTFAQIGRALARDHSTVLHGYGRIATAIAAGDAACGEAVAAVREALRDAAV